MCVCTRHYYWLARYSIKNKIFYTKWAVLRLKLVCTIRQSQCLKRNMIVLITLCAGRARNHLLVLSLYRICHTARPYLELVVAVPRSRNCKIITFENVFRNKRKTNRREGVMQLYGIQTVRSRIRRNSLANRHDRKNYSFPATVRNVVYLSTTVRRTGSFCKYRNTATRDGRTGDFQFRIGTTFVRYRGVKYFIYFR